MKQADFVSKNEIKLQQSTEVARKKMADLGKVAGSEIDKVKNRLKEQRDADR